MLHIFYKYIVESSELHQSQRLKETNKLMKKAGSVLEMMELMEQRRIPHEMKNIMDKPEHPLHNTATQEQSVFNQRLHRGGDPSSTQI